MPHKKPYGGAHAMLPRLSAQVRCELKLASYFSDSISLMDCPFRRGNEAAFGCK